MKIGYLVKLKDPISEDAASLLGMIVGTKKINEFLDVQVLWYTSKQNSIYTKICGLSCNDNSNLLKIIS